MKKLLVTIVTALALLGCHSVDSTECDHFTLSGTLSNEGSATFELELNTESPLILQGWALIDHGEFEMWEQTTLEIDSAGTVTMWSHGGSDRPYQLTVIECLEVD